MSSLYLRVRAVGSNRSIVETLGPRKGSIMLYGVDHVGGVGGLETVIVSASVRQVWGMVTTKRSLA